MVSQGYWLQAPGQKWHRVKLEDYLNAAAGAGLYAHPGIPGVTFPREFRDVDTGLCGTTADPNQPRETDIPRLHHPGRPVKLQELEHALASAHEVLESIAKQLLTLGQGLARIAELYRQEIDAKADREAQT